MGCWYVWAVSSACCRAVQSVLLVFVAVISRSFLDSCRPYL